MPKIRTNDGIEIIIPKGMKPDDPHLKQLVTQERAKRQGAANTSAAADMGRGEKVLANLGAGFANVGQGIKQLAGKVGIGPGVSPEEVMEKRARDEALAKSMPGGKWTGVPLQIAGEAAPYVAGGWALRGAAAVPQVASMLPRAVSAGLTPARLGTLKSVGQGAAAGATAGLVHPATSGTERAFSTGLGAAGGMVLPGAVAGYRGAGRVLGGATGARSVAGDEIEKALLPQARSQLGHDPTPAEMEQFMRAQQADLTAAGQRPGPPLSAAESIQSPGLGRVERQVAKNAQTASDWVDFRGAQNVARHTELQRSTPGATQVPARIANRDRVTAPIRARALQLANRAPDIHTPLAQTLQQIGHTADMANPSVRRLIQQIDTDLAATSPQAGLGDVLYQVRKNLNDALQGRAAPDSPYAGARAASAIVQQIKQAIDAGLDQGSGGEWSRYLNEYQRQSRHVTSAQAQAAIREPFAAEAKLRPGDAPMVNRHNLGKALDQNLTNDFGRTLPPRLEQRLMDLQGNVRASDLQANIKNAGTSLGGSNTEMDRAGDLARDAILNKLPFGLGKFAERGVQRGQQVLSDALQNPATTAQLIQAKLLRGVPLTPAEQAMVQGTEVGIGLGAERPLQR